MQSIAASIVVVSGTMLWIAGAILEFQAYATPVGTTANRSPGEFAEWGGLVVVGLGIAMIARGAKQTPSGLR